MMKQKIGNYTVIEQLGQGAFGLVYKAELEGKFFALKKIRFGKGCKQQVSNQANLYATLNHQNLLKAYGYFFDDKNTSLVIVLEYCHQGSLEKYIGKISDQKKIISIMTQITAAFVYLHDQKNIIHRDIKPENILIKNGVPKVADLGLAKILEMSIAKTKAGTPIYMSPDILKGDVYRISADIWSLGVMFLQLVLGKRIYEVVKGLPAFSDDFPLKFLPKIQNPQIKDVIVKMLRKDPKNRPKIGEVFQILKSSNKIKNPLIMQKQQQKLFKVRLIPKKQNLSIFSQGSAIVSSEQEINRIKAFFNKKITKLKLVYRASQNQFSVKKFHQKCDNIANTLVVCQTQFKKKVGGFTPLTWQSSSKAKTKSDQSGESFIFSLTHNDKFTLQNNDFAIANSQQYGLRFGYYTVGVLNCRYGFADFYICDRANQRRHSCSFVNSCYYNHNYEHRNPNSLQRFCGNPRGDEQFKVIEWEVWQVNFN